MALWEELYIWSQTPALMHFVLIVFSWTVFVIHSSQGQTNDQSWLHLPHDQRPCLNHLLYLTLTVQFSSVAQLCPTLCEPMDCSMPGFPVHHQLPELTQIHVYRVSDAIQPSHPLSSPSLRVFNLSQHQDLFQWVSSSHQTVKVLEFQLQHQSFQWIFKTDFL